MGMTEFFKKKASISQMLDKAKEQGKNVYKSDSFYKPARDKDEQNHVVMRFLPSKIDEDLPWKTFYRHVWRYNIDGAQKWIDTICPSTWGESCPVCDLNRPLWDLKNDKATNIARTRGRKQFYLFNVYIISDTVNPEYNGTVQPFVCGKSIYKIIEDAMTGDPVDGKIDPFDVFEEGRDFHLLVEKDGQYITYKKSKFSTRPSSLDADLAWVSEEMHDLEKLIREAKTMTPDDLQQKAFEAYSYINKEVGIASPKASTQRVQKEESHAFHSEDDDITSIIEGTDVEDDDISKIMEGIV